MLKLLKNMERDANAKANSIGLKPNMETMNVNKNNNSNNHKLYYLFTDGSEIKDKKTYKTLSVGWGFVFKEKVENNTLNTLYKNNGIIYDNKLANNQRAELVAILEGLNMVSPYLMEKRNIGDNNINNELIIYTDSEYSMKCITTWSRNWERNGWINSKNKPVKHQDVIKEILFIYRELSRKLKTNISIHHIKSHTTRTDMISRGNAEADEMATNASRNALFRLKNTNTQNK